MERFRYNAEWRNSIQVRVDVIATKQLNGITAMVKVLIPHTASSINAASLVKGGQNTRAGSGKSRT